ncbi:MAG: DUF1444 family protein [Pseudomonadota bacterium]
MMRFGRRGLFVTALLSLLPTWLRPAKATTFSDGVGEFRGFVMAAVDRRFGAGSAVADPSDPATFTASLGDKSITTDVTNLFNYLLSYPEEDPDEAVERFVDTIAESRTKIVSDDAIVAVVRNRDYVAGAPGLGHDILHEPLGADLVVVYMADRTNSMSPLTAKDIPGRDLASVWAVALNNLRKWLPKVVSDDAIEPGIAYFVDDNTLLATSLILLDEFWKSIAARFPGDVLIAIPRKDQLFIFDDDGKATTRAAARQLIDVTIEGDFNLLSPLLYARRGGTIVTVAD